MELTKQHFTNLLTNNSSALYYCKHEQTKSYHLPCSICFKSEYEIRRCFELDINKFNQLELSKESHEL